MDFRTKGWTQDERGAEAVRLFKEEGKGASELAKRFNVTRNAMIGHLYRHGCRSDPTSIGRAKRTGGKTRAKRIRQANGRAEYQKQYVTPSSQIDFGGDGVVDNTAPDDIANPSPERQTLLVKKNGRLYANEEFTAAKCHWPIGDPRDPEFHFCGRAVASNGIVVLPYCTTHARRAFVMPRVDGTKPRIPAKRKVLEPT